VTPLRKSFIEDGLVTRSVAGDRRSREQLASACLPYVWKTVTLQCGGGPEVEDLVQTAMAQAFADLPRFRAQGAFVSWLHRVTLNVVRQHFRRKAWRALLPAGDALDELPDRSAAAPDERVEGERLLKLLAHHLAAIKEKNRTACILSIAGGFSASEIALIVGCSAESAKKRLQRGRVELLERVGKDPRCRDLIEELGR
jgi:RNA polymerase sigma-70 factor, ECF subfamily